MPFPDIIPGTLTRYQHPQLRSRSVSISGEEVEFLAKLSGTTVSEGIHMLIRAEKARQEENK